jgi:hypothetical protein
VLTFQASHLLSFQASSSEMFGLYFSPERFDHGIVVALTG